MGYPAVESTTYGSGDLTRRGLAGLALALAAGAAASARAQAPFATDDAGTTPARRLHFEVFAVGSDLPDADHPASAQRTLVTSLALGLSGSVEVGLDWPWIGIRSDGAADVAGGGDLNLYAKWRWLEAAGRRPALALVGAVELPSGDQGKGLGSGERDETLNAVAEWRGVGGLDLRANLGVVFAGNSLTGKVGLATDSHIGTAGFSVTAERERHAAGVELTGAFGRLAGERTREIRLQTGLRWTLGPRSALGAAVQRGWYAAPPWQATLGLILDP